MAERYPDDASLLALASDANSGVEYIPTGLSPYHLAFRRMLQRTLLACGLSNQLRPYQDGDLSIGIRPGRYRLGTTVVNFSGATGVAIPSSSTRYVWLESSGTVQQGAALPSDRTSMLPLALLVSGSSAIDSLTDLRGESAHAVDTLATLGVTVDAAKLNSIVTGTQASVTAGALNRLTGGTMSVADGDHTHWQTLGMLDGLVYHGVVNESDGALANAAVVMSLPNKLPDDLVLQPNPMTGFLQQVFNGVTYHPVGISSNHFGHGGALTSTQTDKWMGVVAVSGVVSAVELSLRVNLQSSVSNDGITATVSVNGVPITSTHPIMRSSAGSGFRSTARGHGSAAVIKTDGTQNVQKGDVLTVTLTRTVTGSVTQEATDVGVLVVVRADGPE